MLRSVRQASSWVVSRVVGSRFAKPITRALLAAAGLLLLAFIGRTAVAGALASPAPGSASALALASVPGAAPTSTPALTPAPALALVPTPALAPAPAPGPTPSSGAPATADDPVFLNTANVDDLRRLPGVGEKRANAIVALRTRLGGRFHAVEDLLKVKGIGRATLRRLRPLVRLDPPPLPEGGVDPPH
ncbi:MAG TPA: helix-hairpin-helix domain-containing protein [Polyangiaceae bacterium]|jgi:competence protein ComEA